MTVKKKRKKNGMTLNHRQLLKLTRLTDLVQGMLAGLALQRDLETRVVALEKKRK